MEMFARLRIMMFNHLHQFILLPLVSFCLLGCEDKSDIDNSANCGIEGVVKTSSNMWPTNGVKITIESISDQSVEYVAITDKDGKFSFTNIDSDTYRISAEKDGYDMDYILLGNGIIGRNSPKEIKVAKGELREITICMSTSQITTYGQFELTDLNGNPLSKITIPRGATTISMRLFNGTQSKGYWELDYDYCFGTIDFYPVYVFTSFNVSEGYLETGDNVVIVGYVNQDIFSSDFEYNILSQIYLYGGGISRREISVSIER